MAGWDDVSSPAGDDWDSVSSVAPQISSVQKPEGPGLLSKVAMGLGDAPNALGQMIVHAVAPDAAQTADINQMVREKQYQDQRQAAGEDGIDWARLGGNIAGTLPLGGTAGPGASALAKMGVGALSGAAAGALQPVTETDKGFLKEKGKQAALGAAGGVVGERLGTGISRVLAPRVTDDVALLMDRGVTPTPGQILGGFYKTAEDKLTSVPGLGDAINTGRRRSVEQLNKAAYQDVLSSIGKTAPGDIGNEGVGMVQQAVGDSYTDALSTMKFAPDSQFAKAVGKVKETARPAIKKQLDEIIQATIRPRLDQNGQLTDQVLKGAESDLSGMAFNYKKSSVASERELGDKIDEVLGAFRDGLERQNPDNAPLLQKTNAAYGKLKILNKAAAKSTADGVFSPSQLQQAVRTKGGETAFSNGSARMQDLAGSAVRTMGGGYPDSGTVGRLLAAGAVSGGLGAGAYYVDPRLGLLAAPALMYTPAGQKAMAALLTKRPQSVQVVGNAIGQLAPYSGLGLAEFYAK